MANNAFPNTAISLYYIKDLIEYAFRECGKLGEEQTPQYVNAGRYALQQILQDLSNKNVLLFQLRYVVLGARAGTRQLSLPAGTIDIRKANYRYPINPNPTTVLPTSNPSAANAFDRMLTGAPAVAVTGFNWFGAYYASGLRPLHIGINAYNPGTATAYTPIVEYSADGVTWTTFATLPTYTLNDGEWQYYQLDGALTANYWRLRQDISNGILSIRQLVIGNVQQDIPLYRLNRDDYFDLPNKDFQSNRALQYWFDKQIVPVMNLWPVPQDDFQMFQVLLEAQMPDVGNLGTSVAIPNRWLQAIQSMLSFKLALQLPNVDPNRLTMLQQLAQTNYQSAQSGEEDISNSELMPSIGVYTR